MFSTHSALNPSFGNSVGSATRQNNPQHRVLPRHNRPQRDVILFRAASQQKAEFSLANPPEGYSVQFTKTDEVSEMVDFIDRVVDPVEHRLIYEQNCKEHIAQGGLSYIIRDTLKPNQPIIATATLQPGGYIYAVGVDKAHEGKGIATAMMKGLVEQGKQAKMDCLTLKVRNENPDAQAAIHVYEKAGFKVKGEARDNGETVKVMECRLKPLSLHWQILETALSFCSWLLEKGNSILETLFSFARSQPTHRFNRSSATP